MPHLEFFLALWPAMTIEGSSCATARRLADRTHAVLGREGRAVMRDHIAALVENIHWRKITLGACRDTDIQGRRGWHGPFMPVPGLEKSVVAALLGSVITLATASTVGKHGGVLVVAQGSEPKTFNPAIAVDQPTRDTLSVLSADLIHINRRTLRTELALAKSWSVSPDGRHYTLTLRDGLRFSDGSPLTADDVVFTFAVHLDPRVNSPQRDLLVINGQPIAVTKLTSASVRVDLPAPYAPGERLFDSFWILPRHKLERAYAEGRFAQAWTLGSTPADIATMGPFRFKQYVPGQRLILERNPYYWKRDEAGNRLPYLDRIEVAFVADQNAQLLRLLSHEVAAAGRLRPEDVPRLEQTPFLTVRDAGPGLEYNFLFFNWNARRTPRRLVSLAEIPPGGGPCDRSRRDRAARVSGSRVPDLVPGDPRQSVVAY